MKRPKLCMEFISLLRPPTMVRRNFFSFSWSSHYCAAAFVCEVRVIFHVSFRFGALHAGHPSQTSDRAIIGGSVYGTVHWGSNVTLRIDRTTETTLHSTLLLLWMGLGIGIRDEGAKLLQQHFRNDTTFAACMSPSLAHRAGLHITLRSTPLLSSLLSAAAVYVMYDQILWDWRISIFHARHNSRTILTLCRSTHAIRAVAPPQIHRGTRTHSPIQLTWLAPAFPLPFSRWYVLRYRHTCRCVLPQRRQRQGRGITS